MAERQARLQRAVRQRLDREAQRLDRAALRLARPLDTLRRHQQALALLAQRLDTALPAALQRHRQALALRAVREDQIVAAAAFAAEPSGGLDIVVANAGGSQHMGSIPDADADAVRATIDLNLMGTVLTVKAAVPHLRTANGGSVIAMSSGAGAFPHRYLWAYGASKAGIDMFCKSAADELGIDGIRVNSVQPGIVDDELMSFITAGGPLLDHYLEHMPLGRVGTVEDVAEAVRFLAGSESSWITGINLPIDGGHHLRQGADYGRLF